MSATRSGSATASTAAAERARLEGVRRGVERRLGEAHAALEAARAVAAALEAEAEAVDLELGALDLRDALLPEVDARSVAHLRSLLAETGHPVIDVLAYPSPLSPRDSLLRLEFRFAGPRVGVLLATTGSSETVLFVGPGRGSPGYPAGEHYADLTAAAAGDPAGVGRDARDHASNDDVRALLALPAELREGALEVLREGVRDAHLLARLGGLLSLTELDGVVVASAAEGAGALGLTDALAAGAPVEWALRRLADPGSGA